MEFDGRKPRVSTIVAVEWIYDQRTAGAFGSARPVFHPKVEGEVLGAHRWDGPNSEVICTVVTNAARNVAHHVRARHSREAQDEVRGVGQTGICDVDRNGGVSTIGNYHRPDCVV